MNDIVVQAHFDMLTMLGNSGMVWWVSSIVFYTTIFKYTADYKSKDRQIPYLLVIFMGLFLLSFIVFGAMMAIFVGELKIELITSFGILCPESNGISILFHIVEYGFLLGAATFALLFICWTYILVDAQRKDDYVD